MDGKSYAEDSFADLMSPGKLVADGEYFLGWSDGAATYQPRDKYQIKSNHADEQNVITLTAKWGARPAGTTLTYKANGGAGEDVVENLANNATVTTKPGTTFSRVGYTFKGWDTNPKGEGSIAPNTQVQVDNNDGDNVLYAIWTANTDTKYTVEFYYQNTDGTYPNTANEKDETRTAPTDTTVSVTDADKAPKDNNKYVYDKSAANVESGNVAGDGSLVLKLYFKLNTASYTIHHYLNGTTVKVAEDQTDTKTIGETLTANKSDALYAAYAAAVVARYAPSQEIEIVADETKNVITVYYAVPLTITANNNEKTYDGQPLTQPDFTMEGLVNGDTKENFTLSMTTESTITNAGSTPNVIDTDTVKYNGGAIPSYYNVSYNPGTLTVNKASATVTITGVNETAVYDGTQHEANGYNYSFTGRPGQITISPKPNVLAIAKRTDVGTTTMGLTKDSFTVTSANYDVTIKAVIDGYVTITPVTDKVTVTVTENGDIVTYDGNEHSVKGYKSMTADNALYDVTKSVKATETAAWTAKGTNAGEYPVGVAAGDFENTNKNFTNVTFNIVDGVLKINPITENTITITANSASKTYDGTPLTDIGFTFTEGVLKNGDVLTAVVEGSATNVGDEGKNVVKSYKVMRGDVDVTGNYTFGNSIDGKLNINKRTVTLTSETASKAYDGTPLTKPVVTVGGDGFVTGEVTDVKATGSVTFVHEGEVTNAITYTEGANYKESNYTITKDEGKLSITQRTGEGKTITVTAANGEKVYDGAPLTNNGFTHAGKLVEGDVLTAVVEGSQTDVGVGDNVVTSYKVMRGETDVTSSYTFADSVKGALTVTLRGVTFTGESKSLPYTGGMQSITGITQSGLVEGHRYEGLTYKAEGQNVGSYDGAFSGDVVIKDAQGNDVTKNYNVTKTPGTLTITNASFTVTFTGESAEKVYNGKEQSITGITVAGLKTGHRYEGLTYEAKGTDKGEYVGAFTGTVKILDENNVDVTENYAVTKTPGKLMITAVTDEVVVTITGHKDTVTYDGKEHPVTGYDVSISNELYKEADFTFTGSAEVKATNASDTAYAMGLKDTDFANKNGNFSNVTFKVTDGELVINKRPVMVYAEKLEYAYDYANPAAHPADDVARYTVEAANGDRGLLTGDALNADVLYDGQSTQTLIGVYQAVAQIAAAKITNANGDVTANYAIEKVDSTLTITGEDPLDPGKETTSVQTNYTVGDVIEYKIAVKNVSKGEATHVVVTDSMAEIQPGTGYSVSDNGHTATIASIPAGGSVVLTAMHTVTAEDVENAYAGDANGSLTNVANIKFGDWNKDVEGDHDELNDTYEYVVRYYWNNYTSVQPHEEKKLTAMVGMEVTEVPAAIDGYTPVSADSKKLTISADQSKNVIEFYYYKNVELTANSETYTYDGTEKQVNGFTVKGENKDQDDQTIAADFSAIAVGAKGTNAGEYPANFAENTVGTVDATERYIVTAANNGKLVINPVTGQLITITANSNEKTYDGTPLTDNRFDYTKGVLVEGDVLTAVVEGSATNVGDEGKNVVKSYAVKRGETDVTKNYTFGNSIDGKLTINPRKVTLTSETASKEYDGTPLTRPDVDVTGDGFVAGEVTGITATGSVTLVDDGEVTNAITYTPGANFKEKNYTISKDEGTLSITKRGGEGKTITVTANSGEKVYDGAPLTNNGHTHAGALVEGDTLTAVVEGSQTDVGSSDNVVTSYKVMRGETDVTNNYTFGEPIIGTLTVTPVAIELTAASASKQYDGTPLTKNDYEISNGAFVGEEGLASVTVVGSQTLVGESANKITAHSLKGNTLAQNYTITYQPGKLTVTKNEKAITVTANSHTWEYDGQPHSDGGYTVEYDGQTYKVEAGKTVTLPTGDIVKAKITKTVTNVSDSAANNNKIDELTIVNAAGEDTKGQYKTVTLIPGTLTITKRGAGEEKVKITAADNTVEYDGQPHGAKLNAANQIEVGTSFTVTNLADGHSVKTLAIDGSETDAGVYADKLVPGNAVIVDGNGVEVTANYDITYVPGALTITRRGSGDMKVELKAANNTVVYDGQPHGAKLNAAGEIEAGTSYTITNLADGHKVQSVVISGSETAVGEYENRLVPSGAKIVDAAGNDVTRNYVITYVPGTLEIKKNETEIKVTANSHTWEYDGQAHSDGGYTVNYNGVDYPVAAGEFATLPTGDKVTATVDGSVTNVADSADDNNVVTNVTITNEAGAVVNDQYKTITRVNAGLKITRRGDSEDEDKKVKIIAEPNTVEYDGQPHGAKLNDKGEIELGTSYTTARLVDGHYVDETTLDITGSQTNVGVYEEELKPAVKAGATRIVILDAEGNDVTDNYALTLVNATLTITGDKLIPDKKAEDENIESNYKLGKEIEFTITVKNVSIYDVENVIVTDANAEIQAGDGYTVSADKHTATIAIIAAKSEIRIKALHTVTSEDILAGKVGNKANVKWDDTDKEVGDETTKLTAPDVKLTVTKTSDWESKATGAKPALGTKITYTITVKNTGNVPYTNVNFTDLLQNGDATVTGEIPTYGTLAVNEEKSFTVEYIVTEADLLKAAITNKVTAEADEIEYTYYEGDEVKTGKATPKGEAEVTDRTDDATASTISTKTTTSKPKNEKGYELGETITYDIVVTNDGNLTVTSIEVADNLAGAVIKDGAGYTVVSGKAVIAELKPGESVTVKVEYVVTEADVLTGKVVNDATVTGKGPGVDPDPNQPETDDPIAAPKATLQIVKAVEGDPKNGTSYALGEKITYTLTVKVGADNNVTVKVIRVTDTLLTKANVDSGAVEIAGGYTLNENNEIELPDMAPGADDVVITYTYKVQESDLGSGKYGTVHNAATVHGTTPKQDPDNPNPKPDDPKDGDDNDTPTSIRLIITAKDNLGIEYDGQPHGENGYTAGELADSHEITNVTINGSQTNVGRYENELVPDAAKIEDADGKDVTSHYEIKYVCGTLEIIQSKKALKVVANSNSWTYDDAEHSDGGYTVTYGEESYTVNAGDSATLSTGDEVTAVITKQVKNVSDTADGNNEIVTLTVENESQYASIIQEAGTLTITQRPVQVTVNSESFTYDAAEHTVADEHGKEYTIETAAENSGLLPGHTESLNVVYDDGTTKTESRKYVGTYTAVNEQDVIIKAGEEDVTENYDITVEAGELKIEKAEIEIELIGPKSERVYNGQEQVVETTEITTDEAYAHGAEEPKTIKIVAKGLKGEDYISKGTVIHIAKGTYVGEHPGDFVWDGPHGDDRKPTVLNNDGNGNAVDVTENYTFKRTPGSLTITSEHPTQPDKEIDGHEPGTKYALGDRIYFKITVRNITLDTLELVEVYDPTAVIVPGDGYTVVDEHHAKIENMPASVEGEEPTTVIINAYHIVTEDDIKNIVIDSGYKYENVATITVGDKTIDASKGTNDIEDADYTLKIEKQLINRPASGEKFKLGETAKFQITVTNEGNVTQTDIPVAEKLPGAVFTEGDGYTLNADKTVATITKVLNPADKETQHGDSIILYAQYTITENDLGNTGLKNIVTAPNGKPGEEPIPVDEAKSMAGQKIWNDLDNLYDTRTESVTVNLMRSLGRGGAAELIRTVTVTQNSGWRYSFDHLPAHDMQDNEYFYWVVEEPVTGYDTAYETKDESHCDIVNNLQTYTLTIHYWQHKLGDTKMEQAFPDYVATLYYKQPYDVESPEREGIILDDMSQARISGTMPAHDLVIDVYYHRIAYRLTIHYIYQDGTMAHEDYTWTYWFNSTYNVPSPIIPGFTPSIDVIAGRMPSHGLELAVVYVGDGEIVIPDEDTSLGFKSYLNAGECFE